MLLLVLLLGGLTVAALFVVQATTRDWFERDVAMRAELVVAGARRSLADLMRAHDEAELRAQLDEITRDERIMGSAACGPGGETLATSTAFPSAITCGRFRPMGASRQARTNLAGGPVHISAIAVSHGAQPAGYVVLVHDMSFVARRDATARQFLVTAFGVLALAAAVLTILASRLSWRTWTRELRGFLLDGAPRPEFRPLLRDIRELVERISNERDADQQGTWTPARLKSTLARYLEGERVVILANREPYIHERTPAGDIRVVHPASGLVTALEPVMRACSGVWVAHGAGSADRETADAQDRIDVPPGDEKYRLRRVWLTDEEERGYYYGFSNEGLWPLCHVAHARPLFRRTDWDHYRAVNQKFADAVCQEVDSDDPIVLVQDYHFALAPSLIRRRLPRATILSFWHIPWPNAERFGICPWRDEILRGMLGASILGFHTQQHCNNFLDTVDAYIEARIDREQTAVVSGGRATLVRPYPIALEWPVRWLDDLPDAATCRQTVVAELGLRPDALIGVGVDRLDYTKGVEERLLAVERALETYPAMRGRLTFIQLAAPSRTLIERYRELNDRVEAIAVGINERWGNEHWQPIRLLRAHHEPPTVFRYLRAAEFCYVSSLHDGMNLVAKEFVAARDDLGGVLLLSQFTGAARELTEALIVNPYDLDQAAAAMATAIDMSASEKAQRMQSMRSFVSEFNVYRWAGRMLVDAARLRRRERLAGELGERALWPRRAEGHAG